MCVSVYLCYAVHARLLSWGCVSIPPAEERPAHPVTYLSGSRVGRACKEPEISLSEIFLIIINVHEFVRNNNHPLYSLPNFLQGEHFQKSIDNITQCELALRPLARISFPVAGTPLCFSTHARMGAAEAFGLRQWRTASFVGWHWDRLHVEEALSRSLCRGCDRGVQYLQGGVSNRAPGEKGAWEGSVCLHDVTLSLGQRAHRRAAVALGLIYQ